MALKSTPRFKLMNLAGWGNVPRFNSAVYRPERSPEVASIVARREDASIIARGLGRSYGDAALNESGDVLIDTRLDRFLDFDPATGTLECEAGATFDAIIGAFLPRGFFPPVTPGTKYVTVGGAIAADVHGKNHHRDGSIAEFIDGFDLLLAGGQAIRCSRQENPDAFWATLGGMGLTGIIQTARLRLRKVESAYITVDYKRTENLDQTVAAFADGDENFQYSVAWIDCLAGGAALGRSVLIRGNHAKAADLPPDLRDHPLTATRRRKRSVPFNFPGFALLPFTVRLFNDHFYATHEDGRKTVDYDEFFYPLDSVLHWNRIYGRRGFFQYQAVFPAAAGSRCLHELLEKLSGSSRASFLCVLKTMGKGSGGILSFPREGQTLALDIPNRGGHTVEFLRELDQIVLKHGGRVYLAKDAVMTRQSFAAMYPDLPRFNQIKATLDPERRFSSSQSRRLGIGEKA
ncbi:MAG TPA: FAD-binding oxidoreductase [Tepidisphaeraceae bacterium]|jgi:FAD/FMN-containing dehydrogenase|nr:FAD-binding oxidoreductase [Tepidisphaeraceae bacterium]